jgi:hypothetical protein
LLLQEMLETLHRVDTGSEHDHSSFNANGYHQSYESDGDEEGEPYADDEADGYDDDEDEEDVAGDDDDRTESTALATLDNGYGDWSSASGSHRRQQTRRLSYTDDGSASEHHRLGEDADIEDSRRSEQEDALDDELRAAAEAVRDVEYEQDTWTGDEDTGWLVYEVSLEEFQQQEQEAAERLALTQDQQDRIREWHDRMEEHERRLQLMQARRMMGQQVGIQLEQGREQEDEGDEDGKEGDEAYDGMEDDLEAAEAQLGQLPGAERDRSSIIRPPVNETQSVASQTSEDRSQDMFDQRAVWPDRRPARDSIHPADIQGQMRMRGVQGEQLGVIKLRVIFEPHKTGFEETKDFNPPRGAIIAGRYKVLGELGQAAFSTALQCVDMKNGEEVCLKMIKNNKDYFDQSIDEIKLLQYINTRGDPDEHHVLRLYDFFYHKEHLFLVSELLRENLYEFQRFLLESGQPSYFTIPRLKKIMKQVLEALHFIHGLNLIHCDVKPENIVIKSYSRCEVKLIDFGSSCYTHDHATSYIQSRSYRAPEVILALAYNQKIDIWSLGAVLAELFTGYVLFQNESIQTMLARIGGIVGTLRSSLLRVGTDQQNLIERFSLVCCVSQVRSRSTCCTQARTLTATSLRVAWCTRRSRMGRARNLFTPSRPRFGTACTRTTSSSWTSAGECSPSTRRSVQLHGRRCNTLSCRTSARMRWPTGRERANERKRRAFAFLPRLRVLLLQLGELFPLPSCFPFGVTLV